MIWHEIYINFVYSVSWLKNSSSARLIDFAPLFMTKCGSNSKLSSERRFPVVSKINLYARLFSFEVIQRVIGWKSPERSWQPRTNKKNLFVINRYVPSSWINWGIENPIHWKHLFTGLMYRIEMIDSIKFICSKNTG